MELVTKIANVKPRTASTPKGMTQIDTRTLERMRFANAQLQRQVVMAQGKAMESMLRNSSDSKVASLTDQLANAEILIADLKKKVRELTTSLENAVANAARKDRKQEKPLKSDKQEKASAEDNGGIRISVN